MGAPEIREDIAQKFFELCNGLEVGEMATTEAFRLGDVMSAIELMDPKMDVGVGTQETRNLETAIAEGLNRDDMPMQIAIMDATFAMIVAWLEGSSLGSTVWTNLMLGHNYIIENKTFAPFVKGVNLLVRNIYMLINSVGNLEELPEDFNPQIVFMRHNWQPRSVVLTEIRDQVAELKRIGAIWKTKGLSDIAGLVTQAACHRYELIDTFLEIFAHLVPPEIEDPLYPHKVHLGNCVVSEHELDKINEEKEEGCGGEHCADGECCEEDFGEDEEDEENNQFKPNFQVAAILSERLIQFAKACQDSVYLGRKSPDNKDGDYSWLPAFDHKACVALIPACFPRQVQIKTRKEALGWILNCAFRIHDLSLTTPNTIKDLSNMFYFARTFNLNACVLTRSLLQICMFPTDNHLCGNLGITIADPIESSLVTGFNPQVLQDDSPVHKDHQSYKLYMCFLNYMTKLAIQVYSSFGCNLSRQRDRLEIAINELGAIQFHAGTLETRTDEVLLAAKHIVEREDNPQFHSVATFVFHNLLAIIHHYFELGFRMELYVPYEFTYMYWYMGEVEARWMLSTMERSHEIQLMEVKRMEALVEQTKDTQLKKDLLGKIHLSRKRLTANQFSMVNQYAMTHVCHGIVKATVVMIRKGYIKMPPGGEKMEELRYERRMEVFENLGPPLHATYEMFKNDSKVDELFETDITEVIKNAASHFNAALRNLVSMDNKVEKNRETINLTHVSNKNVLACKLLALDLTVPPAKEGDKPTSRGTIQWVFNDDYPLWPVLQLIRA